MSTRERWIAAFAGLIAGLAGGAFGVGGGIVLVPLLVGPLGLTQHQAVGTSLAVVGVTAATSLVVYAIHGNVAWLAALVVGAASFFAARFGARWAARTSSRNLARAFAVLLIVVAVRLLLGKTQAVVASTPPMGLPTLLLDLAVGVGAGLLAGYMGVGGGVLIVPALTLLGGLPQAVAQGTSLAVILLAAPGGAIEHHRHRNLVLPLVPWLALGAAVGGPLAALAVQRMPGPWLARAFAVFLLVNAVFTWRRAAARA